jgi:hypothetical protein
MQTIGALTMTDQFNQTARDELNEIRAVGKNSRRGKVTRKRRNGGKDSTRLKSAKEQEREDLELAALCRELQQAFSAEDSEKAELLLCDHFKLPALETTSIPAYWTKIGSQPGAMFVLKGDDQHREALKLVYATAVKVARSDEREVHIQMIAEQLAERFKASSRKRQKRKIITFDCLLRAITRLRIDFGKTDDEDIRYRVWEMAAAIRYLRSKDIGPHEVDKFHADHGGGLRKWALLAPQTSTRDKKEVALEVKALAEDRHYKPMDMSYYDDDAESSRQPIEVPKIPEFDSILLRYCVNTMGPEPGGFLFLGVSRDTAAPLGAKVVLSSHIERIGVSPARLEEDCKTIVQLVERLLKPTPPRGPYTEDGWLLPDIW